MAKKPRKGSRPAATPAPDLDILRQVFPESKVLSRKEAAQVHKRTASKKARAKAKVIPLPAAEKKALSWYGLGAAQSTIKARGKFWTAKAALAIKKNGLKIKRDGITEFISRPGEVIKGSELRGKPVFSYSPARPGWVQVKKDGIVQKKLMRQKRADRLQKSDLERKRVISIAAKTGKSATEIRKMFSQIRDEERANLKKFKRTAEYKNKKHKRAYTLKARMAAIYGAISDLLEIHGSD